MFKPNNIELRDEIKKLVLLQKNKEYVHGGHGPDNFDCAGLVWFIYSEILGIDIYEEGYGESTTTMIMTSNYGKIVLFEDKVLNKDLSLIKTGDILFFHRQSLRDNIPKIDNKYPGHCGIYLGNNRFIHASGTKKKILINTFNNEYWYKKLVGSKDYIS